MSPVQDKADRRNRSDTIGDMVEASSVAVLVNGEPIAESEVRREAESLLSLMTERMPGESPATLRARSQEWALDNLIEAALLRQTAMAQEASADPKLALQHLIERITAPTGRPRHKDVVAYYLKNKDSFEQPETIRAAHIVKNVDEQHSEEEARTGIERAQAELAKGRPFAEVADELSDCPGGGGDLGFFPRGEMVPAFEEVVFRLEPGAVSPIFRSDFGFHIATLLDRRPAGVRKLEEVQSLIEETIYREKQQKRLDQYVDQLRAKAKIEKA